MVSMLAQLAFVSGTHSFREAQDLERVVVGRHPVIVSMGNSPSALRLRRGLTMGHYACLT